MTFYGSSKIKLSLKNIILSITALIFIVILISITTLGITNKKPTAVFYGISEKTVSEITKILQTTHTRKNKKDSYNIVVLNSKESLENALKKAKKSDLLFIYNGVNAEYASSLSKKRNLGFDASILNEMSSSVRNSIPIADRKINSVPLLIDHYEIDVDFEKFTSNGISGIETLSDIELLALKTKSSTMAPIVIPANNSYDFINIFGALVEANSGSQAYLSAASKIRHSIEQGKTSQATFQTLISEMNIEGAELYETILLLKKWISSEILPKNLLQLTNDDIKTFMSSNLTTISFMSLSQHRTFELSTISKYSSIFFPPADSSMNSNRRLCAPLVLAIQLKKNKIVKKSIQEMATSLQGELSMKTGLAPVARSSRVPDKQADDVRYWVASSGTPVYGFSELFTNDSARNSFANALKTFLK